MNRSTVRSAGLAILLTMNGCGSLVSSGTGTRTPGLNVAEAALEGGSAQIALAVSDGVLRGSPKNVRAMEIKGDALALLGDTDAATTVFQALLARDPDSVRANIGLGRLQLGGDPAAAEISFLAVLRHDPKNLTALNNLGIARDMQGRHAEAQSAYHQALAADPDLDSAQVNMALSLAVSGHSQEAVQMLRAKASQPNASLKVQHDYGVALALSGDRAGAERLLGETMSPEDVHQVLDNVTGTRTRLARGTRAPDDQDQRDGYGAPPDVVQVPEVPATRTALTSTAVHMAAAVALAPVPISASPPVAVASVAAAPPMVVRPQPIDPDSNTPSGMPIPQPVNPVAAAMINPRPLALPLRAEEAREPAQTAPAEADLTIAAMPRARQTPPASVRETAVAATQQETPVQATILPAAALGGAVAPGSLPRVPPVPEVGPGSSTPAPAPANVAMAFVAPPAVPHQPIVPASLTPTRIVPSEETTPAVQFAAAPSEEAANAFWHLLVHRFPAALGELDPVVIRVELNGKVFWRVRTEGFGSTAEAQTLCARMRAGGQDCFVPRS